MTFKIVLATAADLPDLAAIFAHALSADPFWLAMRGANCTFKDECAFLEQSLSPRFGPGAELGAQQVWKAVDEDRKMVGWAGLGIPVPLTEEQRASLRPKFDFPLGRNEALTKWFKTRVLTCIENAGYDPATCFQRQSFMVHPDYQRKGVGFLLTSHLNALADTGGAPTYVRARPGAAALLHQMGYALIERIDFDLKDFGVDLGGAETKTAVFALKREVGAKEERGKKLDWSGYNWKGAEELS